MRILPTKIVTGILTCYGVFFSAPCFAEVVEYDIEIVIFEDTSNRYLNSEHWPKNIWPEYSPESSLENTTGQLAGIKQSKKTSDTPDTTDLVENDATTITENKINLLQKHIKRLKESTRYNILTLKAWRQTGLDAESAIDVHIDSTNNDSLTNKTESSIKGTIKMVLGRYLHIYTDMIYSKPVLSSFATEPLPDHKKHQEYLIKSHRRMRSKELHYIDHPLVGILVMTAPVEIIEPKIIEPEPETGQAKN